MEMPTKIPYPCTDCAKKNRCRVTPCYQWRYWFSESWKEVTEVFRILKEKKENEENSSNET